MKTTLAIFGNSAGMDKLTKLQLDLVIKKLFDEYTIQFSSLKLTIDILTFDFERATNRK